METPKMARRGSRAKSRNRSRSRSIDMLAVWDENTSNSVPASGDPMSDTMSEAEEEEERKKVHRILGRTLGARRPSVDEQEIGLRILETQRARSSTRRASVSAAISETEMKSRQRRAQSSGRRPSSIEEDDIVYEEEIKAIRRLQGSRLGTRRPSVTDIQAKPGAAGNWSRKNSYAGNEYLKKDDEMDTIFRNGTPLQIPRKISYHVPTMPILESNLFEDKLNEKFQDIDSEEFKMYKEAIMDEYCMNDKANWEIVGKPKFKILRRGKGIYSSVELEVMELIGGNEAQPEEIIRILLGILVDRDVSRLKDMLNAQSLSGTPIEMVIMHFLKRGKLKSDLSLGETLRLMMEDKDLSEDEMLELLKMQLGVSGSAEMEEMIRRGWTVHQVLEHFLQNGKTRKQEQKEAQAAKAEAERAMLEETKRIMQDKNISDEESLQMLKGQLSEDAKLQLEAMLADGKSMMEIMDHFLAVDPEVKLLKLMKRTDLSTDEKLELILNSLNEEQRQEVKKMILSGLTPEEVLEQLSKQVEAKQRVKNILTNPSLTTEEKLNFLRDEMSANSLKEVEEMMKQGMSLVDAVNAVINREMKKKAAARVATILADINLTTEEKLNMLLAQGDLTSNSMMEVEELLRQGLSLEEAIRRVKDAENDARTAAILADSSLTNEEKVKLLMGDMDAKSMKNLELMLARGMSIEEALKEIKRKEGDITKDDGMTDVQKLVNNAMAEALTPEQILELLRGVLGKESLQVMEDLLDSRLPPEEVIRIMVDIGKTEAEELREFAKKMENLTCDMTNCDKLTILKQHLNKEAQVLMEELLRQGYTEEEILGLFLRCASNLDLILKDQIFQKNVSFLESQKGMKHQTKRDLWSIISREEVKQKIPFMSNASKSMLFFKFFELVRQLTDGLGLTQAEIMNIIRLQLGGDYAREFDELRSQGLELQELVGHFIGMDREEAMNRAKLKAEGSMEVGGIRCVIIDGRNWYVPDSRKRSRNESRIQKWS